VTNEVNPVENSIRNPQSATRNFIGISLGDATGVGPEVALKAIAAEASADDTKYLLIGDEHHTLNLARSLQLNLPLKKFSDYLDGIQPGASGR